MGAQTIESFSLFGFEVPLSAEQFLYLLMCIVGLILLIIVVAFIKARGHGRVKPKKDEEELIKARKAELERASQKPAEKVEEVKEKPGFFTSMFAKKKGEPAEEKVSEVPVEKTSESVFELPATEEPAEPEVLQYEKESVEKTRPEAVKGAEIVEEEPKEDIIVEESKGSIEREIREAYKEEPAEKFEEPNQEEQLVEAMQKKSEEAVFEGEAEEQTKEETAPILKPETEEEIQLKPAEGLAEAPAERAELTEEEVNTVERIVAVLLPKKEKYTPEQVRKVMLGEGYSEKIVEEVVRRLFGAM